MRALVLTKPAGAASPTLSFSADQPTPEPGPGQVLVRVHASAIQPSDAYNAAGGFGATTFPRVAGRDFSGVVVAGSSACAAWSPGAEVMGTSGAAQSFTADGCHADYVAVPAAGLVAKPAALSHAQAATVGVPWTTAALALDMRDFYRREKSLVGVNSGAHAAAAMADLLRDVLALVAGTPWTELLADTTWHEVRLEDAVEAYRSRDEKRKHVIKMLE